MESFLKKAAEQVSAASDKAAAAAESRIGASGAEQVKKYGHEAADKIAHINPADLEGQLKSYGVNIPGFGGSTNATTAGKAAVPTSENATTGGVVTKLAGAVPAAAPDADAPAAPAAATTPATEPAATPAAAVDPAAAATGTH